MCDVLSCSGKTKAPKELHAETQPPGHVAYIGPIEVERMTLCGYEAAKLTNQRFPTQMPGMLPCDIIYDILPASLVCAEAARKPSKTCAALCVCDTYL